MITIGVDIGATKTVIASLDDGGVLQEFRKIPSKKILTSMGSSIDSLIHFFGEYFQSTGIKKDDIRGIGIGVPAVVNSHTKEIISCPNLPGLDGLALGKDLAMQLNIPVFVENDVNLIALGEHSIGRGQGIGDLACVYVGSGLGCGLILNGRLYTGADGAAAEFGHIIYENNGRKCQCGAFGCLEMYCSGKSLTLDAPPIFENAQINYEREEAKGPWTLAEKVIELAKSGDINASELMTNSFSILGWGVTNLVNILNPRLIILGGGIVTGWPEGLNVVKEFVLSNARKAARDKIKIDFPILGDRAGLYGAAFLVKDKISKNQY